MASIGVLDRSHFEPIEASKETFVSYWKGRSVNNESNEDDISHVVYRILGFIALSVAAGVGIAALSGFAVYGSVVIIPVGIIAGIYCFTHARTIEGTHRAQELDEIRSQIKTLSLSQIADQFTWREIFKKGILTPDEFAQAFRAEMHSLTV